MKQLLATMLIALYEGLSFMLEFAPIKTLSLFNVPKGWLMLNDELITRGVHLNMILAIIVLCLLCYNQGLEDGKQSKKA